MPISRRFFRQFSKVALKHSKLNRGPEARPGPSKIKEDYERGRSRRSDNGHLNSKGDSAGYSACARRHIGSCPDWVVVGAIMASKRHKRQNGCKGKVRHATALNASIAARSLRKRTGYASVYKCSFCGGYHLSSNQGPGAVFYRKRKIKENRFKK